MGYNASGYGVVAVKNMTGTREALASVYGKNAEEKLAKNFGIEMSFETVADFLNALLEKQDAFETACVSAVSDDIIDLELEHPYDKFHEDIILNFLEVLEPFTVKGEIEFGGEDGTVWMYKFEDGSFKEFDGVIGFEGDHPFCEKSKCAFNKDGRCFADCLRSEICAGRSVENDHVMECNSYIHVDSLLGFARRAIFGKE